MFETLLSPIELGSLKLKNRIIFAPTSMGLPEDEYFKKNSFHFHSLYSPM